MNIKIHTFNLLAILLLSFVALGYQQLNTKKEYMGYLQLQSTYPTFQVFYNRHFKKSRQFQDFLEVVEDAEAKIKDYARIVFTDCDEALGEGFPQCQDIMDNNENRFTLGLKPNSKFLSLSGKLLQRNPSEVKYNHPLDVYTVAQIVDFIEGLVPSYLVDVVSEQEYQEFLKPRYSTKALYFTKQDQAPLNIKKLSTVFHKRIDFARVEDLSQQIVAKHNIIHFPTLLILKYNYTSHQFQQHKYSGPHFDVQGYLKIKQFLQLHAAQQPRNDLLFHSIKMETQNQILTVNNHDEKDQKMDRMSGMVWIQESATPAFLTELKDKYNVFFNYIHVLNTESPDTILTLFNTEKGRVQEQTKNRLPHLEFISLDYKSLMSNMTFFMQKNYSVMVVPKEYGYFCTITNKLFFQGITNCFIGDPEALEELKKQTGQFEYGVVTYQTANMERGRFSGNQISGSDYPTVYRTLEEAVKIKLDSEIRNYLENPVSEISEKTNIFTRCADPRRKCIVAFLDPSKSIAFKAEQGYLKDIGQQYYSDYRVFWVPLNCNRGLLDQLGQPKATLMVIDSLGSRYQSLKQKITKSILIKFLKMTKVSDKKWKPIQMSAIFNECLEDTSEGEL